LEAGRQAGRDGSSWAGPGRDRPEPAEHVSGQHSAAERVRSSRIGQRQAGLGRGRQGRFMLDRTGQR
jgi:hypothetical protein